MDQQHQQQHAPEQYYAGLDVSLDATSVCVFDAKGAVVWRGKCASTPEAIRDALRRHAPALVRVGLETGQLSNWLTHGLRGMRLPVVCLDARHAKAVLKMQVNKTDPRRARAAVHRDPTVSAAAPRRTGEDRGRAPRRSAKNTRRLGPRHPLAGLGVRHRTGLGSR